MEEIAKQVSSPAFWVLTVVVSLLLNVVSGYIKGGTDRVLSGLSAAYRARVTREKAAFDEEVLMVAGCDSRLQLYQLRAASFRSMATQSLVMAALLTAVACLILTIASVGSPRDALLRVPQWMVWLYAVLLIAMFCLHTWLGGKADRFEAVAIGALRKRIECGSTEVTPQPSAAA